MYFFFVPGTFVIAEQTLETGMAGGEAGAQASNYSLNWTRGTSVDSPSWHTGGARGGWAGGEGTADTKAPSPVQMAWRLPAYTSWSVKDHSSSQRAFGTVSFRFGFSPVRLDASLPEVRFFFLFILFPNDPKSVQSR